MFNFSTFEPVVVDRQGYPPRASTKRDGMRNYREHPLSAVLYLGKTRT